MRNKHIFICVLCATFVAPVAHGASCLNDADCESTSSSGGSMLQAACPPFQVGQQFYIGIAKHSFTHRCNFVNGSLYGSCGQLISADVRYACCPGYYGECSDNTDITTCSCSRCPQFSDASGTVYGTTEGPVAHNARDYSGNAPSTTDCYVPADKGYEDSDGTGTFEFTSKCYYSN